MTDQPRCPECGSTGKGHFPGCERDPGVERLTPSRYWCGRCCIYWETLELYKAHPCMQEERLAAKMALDNAWRPRAGDICRTRDGRKARVVCDDAKGNVGPVVAMVEVAPGLEGHYRYSVDGNYQGGGDDLDLVGPWAEPRRAKVWVRGVWSFVDGKLQVYAGKEPAARGTLTDPGMQFQVAVEVEEGRWDND